ncbi:PHD finger protein rhinoceros-like [Vanessa cardui]|uniref:PHD finger protein rhinoceros-like n=1 Tax=Vanessa cardui TaxID=171605 RepID=UPI001F12EDE1|nr:PHD finger protein rhinoceros-like [Vanessa cardui]
MSASNNNNSPGGCHSLSDPLHGSDRPASKSGGDKDALDLFHDDHLASIKDIEMESVGVDLGVNSSLSCTKEVEVQAPMARKIQTQETAQKIPVVRLERLSESGPSPTQTGRDTRRKGEKRPRTADSFSGSESDASAHFSDAELSESSVSRWLKPSSKRGRGRPPTHGMYVGLGKSQDELSSQKEKERRYEAEDALAAYTEAAKAAIEERAARSRNRTPTIGITENDIPKTSAALDAKVQEALDVVLQVADKSGNLKGTFVRALKTAADTIKGAVADLRALTVTEEVARLEAANTQLSGQLAELRREVALMRTQPASMDEATIQRVMEEALRSSREQFGNMLNARMEGIERRLLPEPRLRPPLATDRKTTQTAVTAARGTTPTQSPAAVDTERVGSSKTAQPKVTKKKGKKKRTKPSMAAQEAAAAAGNTTVPPAPSKPVSSGMSWAAVVRKQPNKSPKNPAKETKGKKKAPRQRKLRPPRTAVITITLKPGAEEKGVRYESVLAEAKSRVKLGEVGLTSVRFRTTATGARMLEVPPGTNEPEKAADALAAKLREVLDQDEVQINRPTKCVEIRVMDLDDAVSADEVVAAVAAEGGCPDGAIRPGVVVRGFNGCRSLWLSCPVAAAKKILATGRVKVGWISARVLLLEPRPLRCYKCLEGGHMGAKCDRDVDRSRLCFRCGRADHKARDCTAAEASCAICSAAGKPAAHAIGSRACPTNRTRPARGKARGTVAKRPVTASQRTVEEPMETSH